MKVVTSIGLNGDDTAATFQTAYPRRKPIELDRVCRAVIVNDTFNTGERIHMQTRMCRRWTIAAPIALTWAAIVVATVTVLQFPTTTTAHAQSLGACESYAHNYARRNTRGMATQSGARNALLGAGVGSLVDGRQGARRGANLGLGAGLLTGSIAAYGEYERHFNRAFRRCMRI